MPFGLKPGAQEQSFCRAGAKVTLDGYGENQFSGAVAAPYLKKNGLSPEDLATGAWVKDKAKADKMADAVREWAVDRGASVFCHWFQPLASTDRHGQAGQVQLSMFEFGKDGKPIWDFKGKDLLQGETDGSSYPNGGLRATHTAGAYLTVDPESPIWLKGDSIFVPACFVSFKGASLDQKIPLKRAVQAYSKQGTRLFKAMGVEIDSMIINIGLEQEFFLVPRDQYYRRPDLQMIGRTVIGKLPARGQELCGHYMAPINAEGPCLKFMQDVQHECFKLGIPMKTRHREVAPNQYEVAALFGKVAVHVDENLKVMQILEEVAIKHGLACLLIEKPFAGVNGSGKHNNWSLAAVKDGEQTNLYNPEAVMKMSGKKELFPVIMAATVAAVDKFGDLMRMSIAPPGNDFRLGAMEAPPAVMSTYLGEQMTTYLEEFQKGDVKEYVPKTTQINLGVDDLPEITAPAEDRNRTSPFPYGGNRFEFRACGSSQNVSLVNTVLAAMMANEFREIAERVEKGEKATDVAAELLKAHFKCVYNGDGYDPKWPDQATERGTWRIDSGIDAICKYTDQKNLDLFIKNGVFSKEDVVARRTVMLEMYHEVVLMELMVMIDMINQHVIPSMKNACLPDHVSKLEEAVPKLEKALKDLHAEEDEVKKAHLAHSMRMDGVMPEVRDVCDEAEAKCPANLWTLATYKELFFVDLNENVNRL